MTLAVPFRLLLWILAVGVARNFVHRLLIDFHSRTQGNGDTKVKEVLSLVLMFGVGFCCLVMVRLIWFQVSSHIECCWCVILSSAPISQSACRVA